MLVLLTVYWTLDADVLVKQLNDSTLYDCGGELVYIGSLMKILGHIKDVICSMD